MIRMRTEYLRRLYELFGDWSNLDSEKSNKLTDLYKPVYSTAKNIYNYVRDVVVIAGAYLPQHVLGMTDRVKIWLRYKNDEDTLDHELWHMEGLDEYQTRNVMSAGLRPNRSKWRIIRQPA